MSGFDDFAPFPPFPPRSQAFEAARPGDFADRNEDGPYIAPNWNIPETQWITWGGEVIAPGDGLATKNDPFAEVARIEVSTPRLINVTISVQAPIAQSVECQLFQGAGRVDLLRTFVLFGLDVIDIAIPGRILRLLTRENVGSPVGLPINVQAVMAPTWPDPGMRPGATLR